MNFLITGASRGIGLELTQFALEAGHNVFAIARSPETARYLNTAKNEYKEKLTILKADVCIAEDLKNIKSTIGPSPIDVLINNAGVMLDGDDDFSKLSSDQLLETFRVNSIAPIAVAQTFLENLKAATNAKLINVTSLMGSLQDNTSGGYYAYRMSKSALNMFTKSFSIDYPNITSLCLHPGWVKTEMGGAKAPLLPRESARGLYKVIIEASKSSSGHYLDYTGKELPW